MGLYRTIINISTGESQSVPFTAEEESAASLVKAAAAIIYPFHVKAEAQRRILVVTGATSLETCIIKQLNANMRATELNDKRIGGKELTAQEQAEASALRALASKIKEIRAASNELEKSPPDDFADDKHWPS